MPSCSSSVGAAEQFASCTNFKGAGKRCIAVIVQSSAACAPPSRSYQTLLIFHPPMPKGHAILRGYAEALAEEYKGGAHAAEDWTMLWFEQVADYGLTD